MLHFHASGDGDVLDVRLQIRVRQLLIFIRRLTAFVIAVTALVTAILHLLSLFGW
jgi:hypothetical protein